MNRLLELWKQFWAMAKPDPYFHIAWLMQMEGYTDFEIDLEIAELKRTATNEPHHQGS